MKRQPFKQKKKVCKSCGKTEYIFSQGRCMRCAKKEYAKNRKPKPQKPLRRKPTKKKRSTPTEAQKWKKKVDEVFSQYIRLRDSDDDGYCKCITCDYVGFWKGDNIQNGHFRSRRYNSTRFDETNCNAQCAGCNVYKHGEQYIYGKKLDEVYGEGTADALVAQSLDTRKITIPELKEMYLEYSEKVSNLLAQKQLR